MARKIVLKPESAACVSAVSVLPEVSKALRRIREDEPLTLSEQVEICGIASPTFSEGARAEYVRKRLERCGLDAFTDPAGNVLAMRRGESPGPLCVLCAHLDTSYPASDISVRQEGETYFAPGIGEDARGLAVLIETARALSISAIRTKGSILFAATSGEEGNGELRGAKYLFSSGLRPQGFLSLFSTDVRHIPLTAMGSRRFEAVFTGPGGHSLERFGKSPSAIAALCRAGALFADMEAPKGPRTTFNLGLISGGSSINAIAQEARCEFEVRSEGKEALDVVSERALSYFERAAEAENRRWGVTDEKLKARCLITQVGDRPAGALSPESPVAQAAAAAQNALGIELKSTWPASSDFNIPLSLGIDASGIGSGGTSGLTHAASEWFDSTESFLGPQLAFLTLLALVGAQGGPEPMLEQRL